jgi:hypothetical protein
VAKFISIIVNNLVTLNAVAKQALLFSNIVCQAEEKLSKTQKVNVLMKMWVLLAAEMVSTPLFSLPCLHPPF